MCASVSNETYSFRQLGISDYGSVPDKTPLPTEVFENITINFAVSKLKKLLNIHGHLRHLVCQYTVHSLQCTHHL